MYAKEHAFDAAILDAAGAYNVPVWFIKAVIATESSFDHRALNPNDPSRGLMQITPWTARGLGYTGPMGDDASRTGGLYEPTLNVQLGTKLIRELRDRYPSEPWDGIYAAYNRGRVERDDRGEFVNVAGVNNFRRKVGYFNPDWQTAAPGEGFTALPPAQPRPVAEAVNRTFTAMPPAGATRYGVTLTPRQWAVVLAAVVAVAIWYSARG